MSVQEKNDGSEEEISEDLLEEISKNPNIELRKDEILKNLKERMGDKQLQKESDKPQNPQPELSSSKDQENVPKQSASITIVEQYFQGYEECLKKSITDDYETIEVLTKEELEMVPKHMKKSDK